MAKRVFKHYCSEAKEYKYLKEKVCKSCGVEGQFIKWEYDIVEKMLLWLRLTGFKQTGPHVAMVTDLLYKAHWKSCPDCKGEGIIGKENDPNATCCKTCKGFTGEFTCDARTYERIIFEILSVYPRSIGTTRIQEEYWEIYGRNAQQLKNYIVPYPTEPEYKRKGIKKTHKSGVIKVKLPHAIKMEWCIACGRQYPDVKIENRKLIITEEKGWLKLRNGTYICPDHLTFGETVFSLPVPVRQNADREE
ncbi:MAG: hypothetical protein ACE5D7_08700 [Fidelibacterota bacterium]